MVGVEVTTMGRLYVMAAARGRQAEPGLDRTHGLVGVVLPAISDDPISDSEPAAQHHASLPHSLSLLPTGIELL
jgi:hypothetical protein